MEAKGIQSHKLRDENSFLKVGQRNIGFTNSPYQKCLSEA